MMEAAPLTGLNRFLDGIRGQLTAVEPIAGDLEQRVYRIGVRTADGVRTFIYKRITPHEALWYGQLRAELDAFSLPPLALEVDTKLPFLILPDLGPSLKDRVAAMPEEERVGPLIAAARRLAALHVQGAELGGKWRTEGLLNAYPLQSSIEWARQSLEALRKLSLAGWKVPVNRWQRRADQIYAHLQAWTDQAQPWTLVHGDAHLGNLLCTEDGQLTLVDWEYFALAPPQRDITVLLQDVFEPKLGERVVQAWQESLAGAGMPVDRPEFRRMLEASRFDNTLMMLACDIRAFWRGTTGEGALEKTVAAKLGWLEEAFGKLSSWL